jgi:hypothetical protein
MQYFIDAMHRKVTGIDKASKTFENTPEDVENCLFSLEMKI